MDQLAFGFDVKVCNACGSSCGRPTRMAAGKPGTLVWWHVDDRSPFDPPAPGERHPANEVDPAAATWPCPHCAVGPYEHRDNCPKNNVHPPDCRCAWTHGIVWKSCRRPDCGRGAHTAGPAEPDVVVCRVHGRQTVVVARITEPTVPADVHIAAIARRRALRSVPAVSPGQAVGLG
jgi:hypothetical protein